MKKIKVVAMALAAVLTVSCFSGCGNNKTAGTEVDLSGNIPENLTIFSALGGNVASAGGSTFNDCLTFQLLEKDTGCHVEWQHPSSGAVDERFNVMIVSGEYPDAIVYNWAKVKNGAQSYVDDGVIVDLTDYIETCMPNFYQYMQDHPELKKDITTDDGRILYIPFIRKEKELCTYQGPVIRKDWLDKLGLEVPKNTVELYEVLKAFKTRDPNGNGKADEIPMGGVGFDSMMGIGGLMWSFGTTWTFHLKDGKVVYGPTTKEFQEGLEYIAKLYSEGLIDIDYLLDDRSKYDAKFTNNTIGFGFGYQPSTYYPVMNDGTREVAGIGYIAGTDGKKYCFNPAYVQQITTCSMAVSTSNKNVAGTLKWLDRLYGGDGYMYANFGQEGLSYEMKDGEPVFTEYMTNNSNGKTFAQMVGLTCAVRDSAFPMLQSWDYYRQTLQPWGIKAIETWLADEPDTSCIIPATMSLSAEESEIYTNAMTQIETYVKEEMNKVVTGKTSADNWPSVVEKINSMGISKVVEVENAAYKRYKDR